MPIWDIFVSLSREWDGVNPRPISAVEIKAYCGLAGINLDPIEFKLLKDIDREFIKSHA